ncbi:hypothetical protein FB451DRAFT_1015006 [Mycena latifolia]|nr:hypothetical protein FB451DRAFT_1015006 [Mycena latifolia]
MASRPPAPSTTFGSLPAFAFHRQAQIVHKKAWGHSWPRRRNTVKQAEIGQMGDGDELYVDGGITDHLDYWCLDGIRQIAQALAAPINMQDILVIREEYESILAMLDRYPSKLFVITGHPGIGKTTFLVLLFLYRLERRLPTAIQLHKSLYFIFDEHGATVHNAADLFNARLQKCWALCDSNALTSQPCEAIQSCADRIVLTTSPKPEKWKELRKQLTGLTLIIDLPTVMEIAAVVKELKLDTSATLGHVGKWGPSLRTIIAAIREPFHVAQHENDVQGAASALASSPSSASVTHSEVGNLPTSGGSNLLFLSRCLRPAPNVASDPPTAVLTVPTKHLAEIFDQHAAKLTAERSFDVFCMLSSHSLTRTIADWMHEKAMHRRMMSAGRIQLFRGQEEMWINTSTNLLHGTAGGLKSAGRDNAFYWMPSVTNFPSIDGVLGDTDQNLFTVQATIAGDHREADEGIHKAWDTMSRDCREGRKWHFVLVCGDVAQANSLVHDFSRQMKLTLGRKKVTVKVWGCVL